MRIITHAIERLIPARTPAFVSVAVSETVPGTRGIRGSWTGTPADVAERVYTALYGRPTTATAPEASPLEQAHQAKRNRDLAGEVGALMSAGTALESAPWYPVRPGDLVHVHYEAAGQTPAFGETYLIGPEDGGLMSMRLLAHTLPDEESAAGGMIGCFAVEAADDPIYELWVEAGPHRLTIVRDGRPVHTGRG
ncbi:hypothetical protein CF54_04165 [Streptomyces sp. Tu 6176]|nr:hypothetical protein CF54_04165 [Streptomyces sp. Tu 6176]